MIPDFLTPENFAQGFLIDEQLMGGVTTDPERPGVFVAYILRHTTGEYLAYQPFERLEQALRAMNRVQRPWRFEKAGGCGGGKCGEGSCKGGLCGQAKVGTIATPGPSCKEGESCRMEKSPAAGP